MMSEDFKPIIFMDASGNSAAYDTSPSSHVPLTLFSDSNSDNITRDAFVVEEVVATDKTTEIKQEKDKTYKIVALFSPKTQTMKQQSNQQPQYIFTNAAKPQIQINQPISKFQVITPSKYVEPQQQPLWMQPNVRKRTINQIEQMLPESRRRKTNHSGKGLRHFSMKVCEKVKTKGVTTYNEVADELVSELYENDDSQQSALDHMFDQKNIRRRVYDALNVLMAMNIISKEKKEIKWIGLPTSTNQEYQSLETEAEQRRSRLQAKRQQLCELILQQIAFKNLMERNQQEELTHTSPQAAIQLPFILISTNKKTIIDCNISNDKYEFVFNFDNVFSIHDDIDILKSMSMCPNLTKQPCTEQEINNALKHLPVALHSFFKDIARHQPLSIKTEPDYNSHYRASCSVVEESLDDTGWTGLNADLSHHSSVASRSDQPSPNYTNDSVDSE